ncbi:MAG: hypothetical protein KH382_08080 [Clostridiales bacterium]|jgi:hypothetical protein|nr:hypothetical protein [Clostridiales bacterium]DAH17318.1 MAG TPA: hypothetical protein [Caudoviricetes sp.]
MKHYESASVLCPFYHSETAQAIHCEGTESGNVIHLIFWEPQRKADYKRRFCCGEYKSCPLHAALLKKYEAMI